jgi:tRNA(adenine34) deaminase
MIDPSDMPQVQQDEFFMREALAEAAAALEHDDVPVGAVVVRRARVIARGHNQRELLRDPTAHAEMIALTSAAQSVGSWRLDGCTMFVTLEPCAMCAGAIVQARMARLVYAANDPKAGACGSLYRITTDERLNHRLPTEAGVLAAEASELLSSFFVRQRALGKK